jgi:hypothetical protein
MADKNAFGVEKKVKSKAGKSLEPDSIFAHLDVDGDGILTDSEMSRAKEVAEFQHTIEMRKNEDAKEDQIRKMAWFALWGMLLYPVGIIATGYFGLSQAADLLSDIAPTYFVAISALVAAFFGAQAYTKAKK